MIKILESQNVGSHDEELNKKEKEKLKQDYKQQLESKDITNNNNDAVDSSKVTSTENKAS